MRTTSRMHWNVPSATVGRIFLVAIALDDDSALERGGEARRRASEEVARSVFALPRRPRISRGRPLRCQRGA